MNTPNKSWRDHIPSKGMNDVIASWHSKQPLREQTCASPSTLTECPRVVWLKKHKVPFTNDMGWGLKQRLMLGRITENLFAEQLSDEGKLLFHWKDDVLGESIKFEMGEGLDKLAGTPDLLINLYDTVLISDSKTSRADAFAYVPLDQDIWEDELWYHYKLQVEAYYMLCHKNKWWFTEQFGILEHPDDLERGMAEILGGLLLPKACHLFSYALDDGVVKRDIMWKPTKETALEIMRYVRRWNEAYASEQIPNCLCTETDTKFCRYASAFTTTRTGKTLGIECCSDQLTKGEVK